MATEPEPAPVLERQWPRCSAYVIEGGLIRPAPDGVFAPYGPVKASRAARSEEQRPYKQLLRLAQRIDTERLDSLGKRERRELERWLVANGLLGILPHETLSYQSWSRWEAMDLQGWPAGKPPLHMPMQRIVQRTTTGWGMQLRKVGPSQPLDVVGDPSTPVPPEFLDDTAKMPETVYRSWPSGEIERAPLAARWKHHFPMLSALEAERHDYPSIDSEEFWRGYAEPLDAFLRWPRRLASALASLAEGRYAHEAWRKIVAAQQLNEISDAAYGTAVGAYLKSDGSIVLGQSAPSLISFFGMMILEDLAAGQQVHQCPICGGYFLSAAYQARFCSSSCRYAHHKRQQRSSAKTEEPAAQSVETERPH